MHSVPLATTSELGAPPVSAPYASMIPAAPSRPLDAAAVGATAGPADDDMSFEALQARFAALQKR